MPKLNINPDDVYLQEGGVREITYGRLSVLLPINAIIEAITVIQSKPRTERKLILASVERSLRKLHRLIDSGRASEEDHDNFASDLAIWFGEEVRSGRHPLKQPSH